jgi:Pyridoxamine 5'-phosphate oxidase
MTITERNLDGYGAPPIEWARVKSVLDGQLTQRPGSGGPRRHTMWLSTINPDGSPHVTAVGVATHYGSWYFTSGPTRKSHNLARDARCVVSVATDPFDLVIEGAAHRTTNVVELAAVADAFGSWPCEVAGDALTADYSAPRPARRRGMSIG